MGACPACKALNWQHVAHCHRCGATLPWAGGNFTSADEGNHSATAIKVMAWGGLGVLFLLFLFAIDSKPQSSAPPTGQSSESTRGSGSTPPLKAPEPTPLPTIDLVKFNAQLAANERKAAGEKAQRERQKQQRERELARRKERLLSRVRRKHDDVEDITWYEPKNAPRYTNYNAFYLYFGKANGTLTDLRLRIQYTGDDWVFVDRYIFKVDDKRYEIITSYNDVKRDNDYGVVWEWLDQPASEENLAMARDIIDSNKTTLRFQGDQASFDYYINSEHKQDLKLILDLYELMSQNP